MILNKGQGELKNKTHTLSKWIVKFKSYDDPLKVFLHQKGPWCSSENPLDLTWYACTAKNLTEDFQVFCHEKVSLKCSL